MPFSRELISYARLCYLAVNPRQQKFVVFVPKQSRGTITQATYATVKIAATDIALHNMVKKRDPISSFNFHDFS